MTDHTDAGRARVSPHPPDSLVPGGYVEPIQAAGAVLWRGSAHEPEVALIHRPHRADWTLPKGKAKNGEPLISAAVREVTEETGLRPTLGRRLPPQRYFRSGWPKQVEWWTATTYGESEFTPNDEVDAVEWLSLPAARARLSYQHDIETLNSFARGPAETFPLVLLRHASACDKRAWGGNDRDRPLNDEGRADALAAARVLSAYGTLCVVSSAAARCMETVLPFAVEHDIEIHIESALTTPPEDHPDSDYDHQGARVVLDRLLHEGRPSVVCTHGELVPGLMRGVLQRLGTPVPRRLALRKGTFWVLQVAAANARSLASIERHAVRG